MAEIEDLDGGSMKSPQELKSEISRLVEMITTEDDCKLKKLTLKKFEEKPHGEQGIPKEFLLAISNKVMVDSVTLENGQGHRRCPQTVQHLCNARLAPNRMAWRLIVKCCKEQGVKLPNLTEDEGKTAGDCNKDFFESLTKCPPPWMIRKQASVRESFGESAGLKIVKPTFPEQGQLKQEVLLPSALSELLTLDSKRHLIGEGAIGPLLNVIREGNVVVIIDASSSIYKLFHLFKNRKDAIQAQATSVMFQRRGKRICVDDGDFGAVPVWLKVLGEIRPEQSKESHLKIRSNGDACGLLLTLTVSSMATASAQSKATFKKIMQVASEND
ncbi:hypothetical protein ACJRO7_032638 [Eucalyptus globulus]|uniref:Uncharacterized protein n=1 Tax=Eucalyptus globulus TaxID=34317 RepID=A0ABD3JJR2_EUCGL